MFHSNSFVSGIAQSLTQVDAQTRGALYTTFLVLGHVVGALTSRQAARHYRSVWFGFVIACRFTVWAGSAARDVCRAHVMPEIDHLVARHSPAITSCMGRAVVRACPDACSEGDTATEAQIAAEFEALAEAETAATVASAPTVSAESLMQQHTIRELKALASQYKITNYGRLTKAALAVEVAECINGTVQPH